MPADVDVHITDIAVIRALNTPGGAIYRWRDEIGSDIASRARATSPVNDPLNAVHRGGVTGTYKAAWSWDRRGSSGHHVIARVVNSANHAIYVEYGRSASTKMQIFSWTAWGGDIRRIGGPTPARPRNRPLSRGEIEYNRRIADLPPREGSRTSARAGNFILTKATVAVLGSQGIAALTGIA